MDFTTPDLCDDFPQEVRVVEPMFNNYGGVMTFGGEIVTIKCFEDNSFVKDMAAKPGKGRVMVVDGGGSLRRALLGDMIAENAMKNGWAGFIIYGCVRDVDAIAAMELGVQALAAFPVKTDRKGIGESGIPVTFGGVTFKPGEFVYADNNGIVVASKSLL